jgi:hypothetical protein
MLYKPWRRPIVRSTKPILHPSRLNDPEDDLIVTPRYYSTLSTGHKIYLGFGFNKGVHVRFYYVWNPQTKLIDSKLEGHNHHIVGDMIVMTPHIDNRKGTTAKATLLYQHLILGKNGAERHIMVTGPKQSEGGKIIWQRLSQMRGINIHGIDAKGNLLNLHPLEDEEEIWTDLKVGEVVIAEVSLIASRKC